MADLTTIGSAGQATLRQIHPHWNYGLITASIAVSLLGAFTSTQLMCQARTSRYLPGVIAWSLIGSLTFGFCSIWSLHFVAMLACEMDVPIGLNIPLTILSAMLAVLFTFVALSGDLIYERYRKVKTRQERARRREIRTEESPIEYTRPFPVRRQSSEAAALLRHRSDEQDEDEDEEAEEAEAEASSPNDETPPPELTPIQAAQMDAKSNAVNNFSLANTSRFQGLPNFYGKPGLIHDYASSVSPMTRLGSFAATVSARNSLVAESNNEALVRAAMEETESVSSRRSSSFTSGTDPSSIGLGVYLGMKPVIISTNTARNALMATIYILYDGLTLRNVSKGFFWSLAITSMHYVGIFAMHIPSGYYVLHPGLVLLSAVISWVVCTVGSVLMAHMEIKLSQQLLFSAIAATGVATMHFTGMWATTFWTAASPSTDRGYPAALPIAIGSIAIVTCMAASGLLAHSATVARNKLAEIVQTRKKLWAAIAQKENAEAAAAARSEFIASASHEIRTPLHQLQGYSDLLSKTQLSEEGRLLLHAIQHATRSLSMITSNVLDWSRLEKGEATCRPVSLDIRVVCESILNLLPNKDDDLDAELLVVVSPDVPTSIYLDETYLQRIFMNLLSNAIKFTQSGYVLFTIEMKDQNLVATVRDSGIGIPPSFLPQLFEPFKQAQTRGAHRGTGLGLAIIKQLLEKMQGTIAVESSFVHVEGVGPEKAGSIFTATIPVSMTNETTLDVTSARLETQVAILSTANARYSEGLSLAWKTFGFQPIVVKTIAEIPESCNYVWADQSLLWKDSDLCEQIRTQRQRTVLIPCETADELERLFGTAPRPRIVSLRKPLVWHKIAQSIAGAGHSANGNRIDRSVRFAAKVEIVDRRDEDGLVQEAPTAKSVTILLVEDNKINQKLGAKMLKTLGYDVMIAEDGQDGIDKILEFDHLIDVVLMDQSMPRKDGLTATKEIRDMEAAGMLSRRRPIIAVTAVVSSQAQALCMEAGTDDFLPKPLSLARLEQTLAKYLR